GAGRRLPRGGVRRGPAPGPRRGRAAAPRRQARPARHRAVPDLAGAGVALGHGAARIPPTLGRQPRPLPPLTPAHPRAARPEARRRRPGPRPPLGGTPRGTDRLLPRT